MKQIRKTLGFIGLITVFLLLVSCGNSRVKGYNVNFYLDLQGEIYETKQVAENENVTKPDNPTKAGYKFIYWQLAEEEYDFNLGVNKNLDLIAKWEKSAIEKEKFTISYLYNYDDLVETIEIIEGATIIEPTKPARVGFNFLGWYYNGELFDFNIVISGDITLTAEWEEIIVDIYVTVTFDYNYDGLTETTEIIKGEKVEKPQEASREGYLFIGWYTHQGEFDFTTVVTSDITLTAIWEEENNANKYSVIFNDGTNPEIVKVLEGEKVSKPLDPLKEGYLFLGWYYGNELFDFETLIYKDYLLTTKWLEISENSLFINEFKDLANNEQAIISGVITSFSLYNYITITDESGSIIVEVTNYNTNELMTLGYQIGNKITFMATSKLTGEIVVAVTKENFITKEEGFYDLPSSIDIINKSLDDLILDVAKLVNHQELTIIEITETNDLLTFTLKNAEHIIEAIYDTRYLFLGYEYLYEFKVNDVISVNDVILGYSNRPYLAIGNVDELIKTGEISPPIDEKHFKIFYLNDTHGAVLNNGSELGLAKLGNYIKKESDDDSLFIVGGDMFQGQLISNDNKGAVMIEIFNHLNLDAFVIGNHEFDWGLEVILKYFDDSDTPIKANFPLLGANVKLKSTNQRPNFIDSHTIITRGSYKIGIVGVIGDGLETSIARHKVDDYYFSDAYTAVKDTVNEIKHLVDFILVVNHQSDPTFNNRVSQLDKVEAIFNGHTHRKESGYLNDVPYIQSKANGEMIGQVDLKFNRLNGLKLIDNNVKNIEYHQHFNTNDEYIEFIIAAYYEEVKDLYEDEIINASTYLSQDDLADFAAKLMAKKAGAVFGFHNYGGTRDSISEGPIRGSDAFKVFPFENGIVSVEILGSDLKTLYGKENNKYLEINYSDINNNSYYKIATNDYLFYASYNSWYFSDLYDEVEIHGDLYQTFYDYLLNLSLEGYTYFNVNSPFDFEFGFTSLIIFDYY